MRLYMPKLIEELNLFELPNVCKNHVLRADVDVMFPNRMTKNGIQSLMKLMGDNVSGLHGREHDKHARMLNNGVMTINVNLFEQDVSQMTQHTKTLDKHPGYDQEMMNVWRERASEAKDRHKLLPI